VTENTSKNAGNPNPLGTVTVITAFQCRAARAMLRWSVSDLSRESGVSEKTIWRIEKDSGIPANVTVDTLLRLQEAFVRQGITFIPEDNDPNSPGPGVRFNAHRRLVPRRQP
jgi:transcriptional regulator with XRE-family HTH domain